ncbi:MAG: cbb3-type cytochrome oxidase assembly protein CcoS [Myxococcota bacterium]|nr:cbb3-type cytochrome oxidase assembly protein CcoS [Myxococcota bacterium]
MSILFVLIPLAMLLLGIAIWAFLWAVDHDQFEDLDQVANSILFDDDLPASSAAPDPADSSTASNAPDRETGSGEPGSGGA